MACRPQNNPSSASPNRIPPRFVDLGFCGAPGRTGLTSLRRKTVGAIVCGLHILAHSCVDQIGVNILFGDSTREEGSTINGYGL